MADRIFNIEKFQSYWENLSQEQRSPDGREIILTFAEEGTQMGILDKDGNTVGMPWRFEPDALGTNLLLQVLQHSGIPTGELADYLIEESVADEAVVDEAADDEPADTDDEPEDVPPWVLPAESTASVVGKALLKTAAIVGTVYMAYRMIRQPSAGSVRFS